jgi:hypothetical protein
MKTIALALIGISLVAAPLQAQTPAPSTMTSEQEVRAVVAKMFDAMRARDTAAFRAIFDSGARLLATSNRNGTPQVDIVSIGTFIGMIGTAAPGQLLDERLMNTEVRVSDNLASVWTEYNFYVGETLSHCGVDNFQLAKGPGGWKIYALADTRRPPATCK